MISVSERELLLLRAQTGDAEALELLLESCRRRLYGQALRILVRPQDAEDAVQEAMLAAFTHLHRFQRRADFLTWATRIVINAALQHIRKTATRSTVAWDQIDNEGVSFSEYLIKRPPTHSGTAAPNTGTAGSVVSVKRTPSCERLRGIAVLPHDAA
jgi:RNA polymerase sigma factor (sigma-70 family)